MRGLGVKEIVTNLHGHASSHVPQKISLKRRAADSLCFSSVTACYRTDMNYSGSTCVSGKESIVLRFFPTENSDTLPLAQATGGVSLCWLS